MIAKQVTIFGGTGFIGSELVYRLAKDGWNIQIVSRKPVQIHRLLPAGNIGQISSVSCNLLDSKSIEKVVRSSDFIVNLIGILYETGKQKFDQIHAEIPERIAEVCRAQDKFFIHISAIGANLESASKYARSKAKGEQAVREKLPEQSLIIRPSLVIGAKDDFSNRFARMMMYLNIAPVLGGGETRFQPIYVGDLVEGMALFMRAPRQISQFNDLILNAVGPRVYSFKELLILIAKLVDRKPCMLPIPMWLAKIQAALMEIFLPKPMLTLDQLKLLLVDNIACDNYQSLEVIGVKASAIEPLMQSFLDVYRKGGRYTSL